MTECAENSHGNVREPDSQKNLEKEHRELTENLRQSYSNQGTVAVT